MPEMIPTAEIRSRFDACREILYPGHERCRQLAAEYVGDPGVPGRKQVRACYCSEHGGETRSRNEVLGSWTLYAPEAAGDDAAVLIAGALALGAEHQCIVVYAPFAGGWTASLGVGLHYKPIETTWPTEEAAVQGATRVWRAELGWAVGKIREARGGTLGWGVPVEPRAEPYILRLEDGQSGYAAYRIAVLREAVPEAEVRRTRVEYSKGFDGAPGQPERCGGSELRLGDRTIVVDDRATVWHRNAETGARENLTGRPTPEIVAILRAGSS